MKHHAAAAPLALWLLSAAAAGGRRRRAGAAAAAAAAADADPPAKSTIMRAATQRCLPGRLRSRKKRGRFLLLLSSPLAAATPLLAALAAAALRLATLRPALAPSAAVRVFAVGVLLIPLLVHRLIKTDGERSAYRDIIPPTLMEAASGRTSTASKQTGSATHPRVLLHPAVQPRPHLALFLPSCPALALRKYPSHAFQWAIRTRHRLERRGTPPAGPIQ